MKKFKSILLDTSLFRRSYYICLFCSGISFVMIAAYVVLAVLFLWGSFLVFYNAFKYRTVRKTRFGAWLIAFVAVSLLTSLIHLSANWLDNVYNLVMLLHLGMCFFVFYSVHTEKELNFRRELYSICRFIVITTTVLGILGLVFLMAEISFEVLWFKFIVYENRFDGLFINPNLLGFIAVFAIFCCHILTRKDFIEISGRERVSRIWIGSCVAVNAISLLLCDSNGAMILLIGYVIFFVIYKMFGSESKFSVKQTVLKSLACLLAGVVIVMSMFLVRNVTKSGFVEMMSALPTSRIIVADELTDQLVPDDAMVTFDHENKNIDSGRFTLWMQGVQMFVRHPVIGIGRGNLDSYGKAIFKDGIKFSKGYGALALYMTDLHNSYLTILVSVGVIGFILFLIFGVRMFTKITKHVFTQSGLQQSALPCMYAFLCAYLIYAFIEIALLFPPNFIVMSFWVILGYTSCFLVKFEPDEEFGTFTLFKKELPRTLL